MTKEGEYKGIWRDLPELVDFQETFLYVWDDNDGNTGPGQKCVLSNAFSKEDSRGDSNSIPVYDSYNTWFKGCDTFNKRIKEFMWPHRSGGNDCFADPGHQDKFSFACILQNTFNAFRSVNKIPSENYNFKIYCLQLADDLFQYADSL